MSQAAAAAPAAASSNASSAAQASASTSLLDEGASSASQASEGSLLDSAGALEGGVKVSGETANGQAQAAAAASETKADGSAQGDKQATGDKADGQKKDEAQTGAPEKYEPFKVPEGVVLSEVAAAEFGGIAKELGLTQANAQKLVDLQSKLALEQVATQQKSFQDLKDGWKTESLKALGPNFKEALKDAAAARDRFLSPETKQLLNESGLGNHKALIQDLIKLGKAISEDGFVEGGKKGGSHKTTAEVLYPSMNQ